MEGDELEVEIDRSEEEIREVRAANVREYFDAKRKGMDFVPRSENRRGKSVSVSEGLVCSFDRIEHYIKGEDAYSEEVKSHLDHIKTFMDLFKM